MDLQAIGVDLGAMYRDCRYWTLLVMIDMLPSHSHLNQAILSDPEQVQLLLDRARSEDPSDDSPTKGPPLHEYNPVVRAIDHLRDSVELGNAIISRANGGEYKPQFSEPPTFGYEDELRRIRAGARERGANSLISKLTPEYIIEES